MYERFTDRARKVMQIANGEAQRFNHEYIGTEHILLGLVKEGSGVAANVLKNLDIDLRKVRLEVEKIVQTGPGGDQVLLGKLSQTPRAKKVIEYSVDEARNLNHNYVGTEHLLLGLLREEEGVAAQVLLNLGLKLDEVRQEVMNLIGHRIDGAAAAPPHARSKTPALDSFGRDLTDQERLIKLGPLVGRQAELRLLFEVLGCRDGRNPLLIGEPGVGKATLVAGLARVITDKAVPEWLRDHRVIELHVARLWGDSDDWTEAARRVQAVFKEARRVKNVLLYIPDLVSTLWVAGGGLTARHIHAELLLMVRRGRSPCVLSATPAEYARCTERWGPFGPAVQPVAVRPMTSEETVAILHAVRGRYEEHHHVKVAEGALDVVAQAADRLPGALPGKAVQLLDRCATRARLNAWTQTPDSTADLDARIERLNDEKEAAVADQDFQRAAALRDQADKLKQEKERRLREHGTPDVAIVDPALIADVARDLAPPA